MKPICALVGRALSLGAFLVIMVSGMSCQPTATSGLTQEEADRIASTYLNARNTADLGLLDQIYDAAVVVHDCSAPGDILGLDSLKSYYEGSHTGFPDFKCAFDEVLVSGDRLIVRWTITGTHTGSLRGLPPTGKAIRFSGLAIDRVMEGKIVEEWVYFNVLDLLQQLGFSLVPPESPTGN
ncbi:ester cyclase [Candidatus Zixiibacteriota bacterium]